MHLFHNSYSSSIAIQLCGVTTGSHCPLKMESAAIYMILKSRVTVRFRPLMIELLHAFESFRQSASKLSIQKIRSGMTLASRLARAISCLCALAFLAACTHHLSVNELASFTGTRVHLAHAVYEALAASHMLLRSQDPDNRNSATTDVHATCVNAYHINSTSGNVPGTRQVATFSHTSTLLGNWGPPSDL